MTRTTRGEPYPRFPSEVAATTFTVLAAEPKVVQRSTRLPMHVINPNRLRRSVRTESARQHSKKSHTCTYTSIRVSPATMFYVFTPNFKLTRSVRRWTRMRRFCVHTSTEVVRNSNYGVEPTRSRVGSIAAPGMSSAETHESPHHGEIIWKHFTACGGAGGGCSCTGGSSCRRAAAAQWQSDSPAPRESVPFSEHSPRQGSRDTSRAPASSSWQRTPHSTPKTSCHKFSWPTFLRSSSRETRPARL
jgi:hypothetical protein